jgi:hypothetical protein
MRRQPGISCRCRRCQLLLLDCLQQLQLLGRLAREAGWRHLGSLALLSGLGSLLEIAGLGVGVSLLLGAGDGSRLLLPVALGCGLA